MKLWHIWGTLAFLHNVHTKQSTQTLTVKLLFCSCVINEESPLLPVFCGKAFFSQAHTIQTLSLRHVRKPSQPIAKYSWTRCLRSGTMMDRVTLTLMRWRRS